MQISFPHAPTCFQPPVLIFLIMQPRWHIDYQFGTILVNKIYDLYVCIGFNVMIAHNSLKSLLYHDLTECWKISIQSAASKLRENEHYSLDSVNAWAKRY
jgi:hypothetical protein